MPSKSQILKDINEASEQVCSIHQDMIVTPFWTACGHVFCADCTRRLLEYDHRCPECREILYDDGDGDDDDQSDNGGSDGGDWDDEDDYSSEGEWDDEDDYSSEAEGGNSEWEGYDERNWDEADEEEVDPHREAAEEYKWEMAIHRAEEAEQYDEEMQWEEDDDF